MNKAKWIRTDYGRGYNAGWVYRTYEYRGHIYTTEENVKRGNAIDEQIWMQHKREQKRIDDMLANTMVHHEPWSEEDEKKYNEGWDNIWKMIME